MKNNLLILLLGLGLLWGGCREKDPIPEPSGTEYKVALVFPQAEWANLKPVVDWAVDDARAAHPGIVLSLEWIDEDGADMPRRVKEVTHDASYAAVIGPEYSNNARDVARQSLSYRIPVLMPMVTSAEFQRIYAESNKSNPNIFCLAQSDLVQCEAVITKARQRGLKTLFMICRSGEEDDYSASFEQFFMFLAREAGLKDYGYASYEDEESLAFLMDSIMEMLPEFESPGLFFVPSSLEDMLSFDKVMASYGGNFWPVLCSDVAHEPSLEGKLTAGSYEGFSLGATEAFEKAWTARFATSLPGGYAQLYDCVRLVADAARKVEDGSARTVLEALQGLTYSREYSGASGKIHFTEHTLIAPEETIYCNWSYSNGRFSRVGSAPYNQDKGWDWSATDIDDYDETEDPDWYEPLESRRAVIVATSTGWTNYRHQADALAMYQMLKGFGYSDDDIILIMQDDVARHPSNPYYQKEPGDVRVVPEGPNLREGAVVDYKLSDLDPEDLYSIFSGVPTTRTPIVLEGGMRTNVLVFWSGHGARDYELKWGDSSLDSFQFEDLLENAKGNHRKMLIVMDTCFSGSIAEQCRGNHGVLFLCSAARGEPSHADMYDEKCGCYLSNGFTRAFRRAVEENPDISLNSLYKEVARQTTGSHAGIYNYYYYGNLYKNTLKEYL